MNAWRPKPTRADFIRTAVQLAGILAMGAAMLVMIFTL